MPNLPIVPHWTLLMPAKLLLLLLLTELAKVEASHASQAAALKEQEAQLKEREKELEAQQTGLERKMKEVERKGRELEALNRKYEKAVADVPKGEDAGTHLTSTLSDDQ